MPETTAKINIVILNIVILINSRNHPEESRVGISASSLPLFFFFFFVDHFLKSIEFVTMLLLLHAAGFWPWVPGILAPRLGMEHVPCALGGTVLTPGPPGKSRCSSLI